MINIWFLERLHVLGIAALVLAFIQVSPTPVTADRTGASGSSRADRTGASGSSREVDGAVSVRCCPRRQGREGEGEIRQLIVSSEIFGYYFYV